MPDIREQIEACSTGQLPDCTPDLLREMYAAGLPGVIPDPISRTTMAFQPTFYQAFPDAVGFGAGRLILAYRPCLVFDEEFGRYEAQTTGDCVSHATRNAGMLDYCADALFGETQYKGRLATEPIYGYRGHGGQGANCGRLTAYISPDGPGGFLPRAQYSEGSNSVDLRVYKSSIGHNWGRGGTPSWLNKLAAANKAQRVYRVTSLEEARDANAAGFGIQRCWGGGFSSKRNADGLAEQQGSWAHAETWVGADDTEWAHSKYEGILILEQNSWGVWNSGPKRPDDQPDGSYWMRPNVAKRIIAAGEVYAYAAIDGFDRERLLARHSAIGDAISESGWTTA